MGAEGAQRDVKAVCQAVWHMESARLIGGLTRLLRGDLARAEELAQDALVTALERWPAEGVPDNPGAWLMATAKRRAIDDFRQREMWARKRSELGAEIADDAHSEMREAAARLDEALDDDIGDDVLRLMFAAAHPALSAEARVALTLRLVAGLTTDEIARAYLTSEPTLAQRLVRAKRTLAETQARFEVPAREERRARLGSVLETIYLIFNEGYAATDGAEWMRPLLCDEALRLAQMLAALMPDESEAQGLAALLDLQSSRSRARTAADGTPVLLLEQNRALWDRVLVQRGLAALARAEAQGPAGFYTIQAAIAACHARARSAAETDWTRIAALYVALLQIAPSPVVRLNHAVALGMAFGPAVALPLVDELQNEPALARYHLLPSVRGDLLLKLGRHAEARAEFERAAALTRNERERALLLARSHAANHGAPAA